MSTPVLKTLATLQEVGEILPKLVMCARKPQSLRKSPSNLKKALLDFLVKKNYQAITKGMFFKVFKKVIQT